MIKLFKELIDSKSSLSTMRFIAIMTAFTANLLAVLTCIIFFIISLKSNHIDIGQISVLILTMLGTSIGGKVIQRGLEGGKEFEYNKELIDNQQIQQTGDESSTNQGDSDTLCSQSYVNSVSK